MPTPQSILKEMEGKVDKLLAIAERLQGLSGKVIAKSEVADLQEDQDKLVKQIIKLDEAYRKLTKGHAIKDTVLRSNIDEKLGQFQKLNASFIEHVTETQGVINVDSSHS